MKSNLVYLFWLLFALFLISGLIFGKQGVYNLWKLKKEERIYLNKVKSLERENEKLMREMERLKKDPEYIEAVIKRELKMIRNDEIIIYFED